jgi:hypothetical protein
VRAIAAGLLLLLLSAGPGLLLTDTVLPLLPPGERRPLGAGVGLGLLVICAYLCTWAGAPLTTLGLLALVTALLVWRRRPAPLARGEPVPLLWRIATGVTLLITSAWFIVPVSLRALPAAWDPAFHVAVTEIIRTTGHLPATLAPYEPTEPFKYPAALHCVLALLARLSGLDSATVFSVATAAIAPLLLLLLSSLGARLGGHRGAGLFVVVLYSFGGGIGSLANHAAWGGLPNLASLVLMLSFVLASLSAGTGALLVATVCAVALAVLHHLSFALVGFSVGLIAALEWVSERRLSAPVRVSLLAVVGGSVAAVLLVLSRSTGRFSLAEALHFDREQMITLGKMATLLGWPVLVAGGIGLAWLLRTERSPARRVLSAWIVALLAFWVAWDIVYRLGAFAVTGKDFTAFTPSRGLTDSAVFLTVAGGIWLWHITTGWLRVPSLWIWGVFFLLAMVLSTPAERMRLEEASESTSSARQAEDFCAAAREKTPENAVIFAPDLGPIEIWLPYLCARELSYFPDRGYATSAYRSRKIGARDPVAFARLVRSERGRPAFYATRTPFNGGRLVFVVGEWRLYEVTA